MGGVLPRELTVDPRLLSSSSPCCYSCVSVLSCPSCALRKGRWRSPACGFSPCRPCRLCHSSACLSCAAEGAFHVLSGAAGIFGHGSSIGSLAMKRGLQAEDAFGLEAVRKMSSDRLARARRPTCHQLVAGQRVVEDLAGGLDARHRQPRVEQADLHQHRGLVPVDVLVRDLVVVERRWRPAASRPSPVGGMPGSIQSISLVWVKRNSISSTIWSAPTVRLTGFILVSAGLPPMK